MHSPRDRIAYKAQPSNDQDVSTSSINLPHFAKSYLLTPCIHILDSSLALFDVYSILKVYPQVLSFLKHACMILIFILFNPIILSSLHLISLYSLARVLEDGQPPGWETTQDKYALLHSAVMTGVGEYAISFIAYQSLRDFERVIDNQCWKRKPTNEDDSAPSFVTGTKSSSASVPIGCTFYSPGIVCFAQQYQWSTEGDGSRYWSDRHMANLTVDSFSERSMDSSDGKVVDQCMERHKFMGLGCSIGGLRWGRVGKAIEIGPLLKKPTLYVHSFKSG